MKTNSIGFIGGGRITKIFLQAFANKEINLESVLVFDTNAEVCASLKIKFPEIKITQTLEQIAKQAIVFIALHPPIIMETVEKISNVVSNDTSVISLAPKITIEKIASKLKTTNIARMIPNATSFINKGYNPVCFSSKFSVQKRQSLTAMFKLLGETIEVTENKLEAYAIISAMLPTYFWFQWEEIKNIGMQMGLSKTESNHAIRETLLAAIMLFYDSKLPVEEVIDLIPVKPIGENEKQISEIYQSKLLSLFEKIKPLDNNRKE
jgi:pyrroline-5-carboxylate reductase